MVCDTNMFVVDYILFGKCFILSLMKMKMKGGE